MAGTIRQSIGADSVVYFRYTGTEAYQVIDMGFSPSGVYAQSSSISWFWTDSMTSGTTAFGNSQSNAASANGAGQHGEATSDGRGIGFFVGTSTTCNASGHVFNGYAIR